MLNMQFSKEDVAYLPYFLYRSVILFSDNNYKKASTKLLTKSFINVDTVEIFFNSDLRKIIEFWLETSQTALLGLLGSD